MAGNANSGRREKPFLEALRMELAAAGPDHKKLRLLARRLIEKAEDGEGWALKEFADRIDGKVPQAVVGDSEQDPIALVHRIERVIVDPANQDGAGL